MSIRAAQYGRMSTEHQQFPREAGAGCEGEEAKQHEEGGSEEGGTAPRKEGGAPMTGAPHA